MLARFNQYVAWKLILWKSPPLLDLEQPTSKESVLSIRLRTLLGQAQCHLWVRAICPQRLLPTPGTRLWTECLVKAEQLVSARMLSSFHPHPHLYSACSYDPLQDWPSSSLGHLGLCMVPRTEATPGKALNIPAWRFAQTPRIAGTGLTAASSRSRSAGHGSPSVRAHSGWLQGRETGTGHRKVLSKCDRLLQPCSQVPGNWDLQVSPSDWYSTRSKGAKVWSREDFPEIRETGGGLLMGFHQWRGEEDVPRVT